MADERDFELLDDYLTNRMSEGDHAAFEQKLKADPDLQHEYTLQKRMIEGIREARVAELKSMLNKVPVPSGNAGTAASKIALGTVVTLMIAAAAYWFVSDEQTESKSPEPRTESERQVPAEEPAVPEIEAENKVEDQKVTPIERQPVQADQRQADKNQTSAGTEHSKPSLARRPDPLSAPAAKDSRTEGNEPANGALNPDRDTSRLSGEPGPSLTPAKPSIVVETDRNNRRYTFHYQFRDGKLFLFGPFQKDYTVMEFTTDGTRAVFLSYNNQYYQLQDADTQVRPLTPVKDAVLIRKLKENAN